MAWLLQDDRIPRPMRVQFSNKSRAYATISLRINSNSINPSIGRRISTSFSLILQEFKEDSIFQRNGSRFRLPRSCKNLEGPSFLQGDGYFSISFASILQEFREDSIFQEVQASIEISFRRSKRAQLETLVVYFYSYFDTQFRRWFRSGEGGEGTTNASALSFPRKFRALEIVGECSTPSGVGWNKTV